MDDGDASTTAPTTNNKITIKPILISKELDYSYYIKQLISIEKKLWKKSETWGAAIEQEIQRRNTFALIALHQENVVGYIVYTCNGIVGHISKVIVVPEWRRRRIGRRLVHEAVAWMRKERKIGSVTLHVDTKNAPALSLYTTVGFVKECTLDDYYSMGRHAYKMRLGLCED